MVNNGYKIINKILLISFILTFSAIAYSQSGHIKEKRLNKIMNIGDISVKKWMDDYTAAFSFTFDDNMLSQYTHVFPIFQQFGFRGTFYIIAGALEDYPYWLYGTWNEFIQMYNAGQEMSSHTMTHPHLQNLPVGDTLTPNTLIYELYQSKKILQQKFPGNQCIDLAYPYDEYDNNVIYYTRQYYEAARAISELPVDSTLTGNDWYKIGSLVIGFDMPRDSLPDDLDELQYFMNYLHSTISQEKWGLLQAHDVLPYDSISIAISLGSYQPISIPWLQLACDSIYQFVQNGDLWVAPLGEVTRYMKERDCFSYNLVSATDTSIIINVTDTLRNDIYNFPLTADIVVPNDWVTVSVFQDTLYDYTTSYISGSNNIIETSVIPDNGQLILYKGLVSGINHVAGVPVEFRLYQNYPNPFNPETIISFSLPKASNTTLKIFNTLGEEVATPVNEYLSKGIHKINYNAGNLSSGVYFYRLISGDYNAVKKMILLK